MSSNEKLNQFTKKIITIVLSVAVLLYIGLQIQLNLGDMIETDMAVYASMKDTIEVQSYIFRDEAIVTAATSGTMCYFFKEGEKVQSGAIVGNIYQNSGDADVQNQISVLDAKINILEKSSAVQYYAKDKGSIAQLDELIKHQIVQLMSQVRSGDLQGAALGQDNLLIDLNRRRSLVQTIGLFDYQLSLYRAQKASLEASLSGEATPVKVSESGYFYSAVDGYEHIFTMDALDAMTMEDYYKLSDATPNVALMSTAAGKLVRTPKWYITVELDKKLIGELNNAYPSNKLVVMFPYSGGMTIEMTIESTISQTNFDTAVLILATDYMPEGFNYARSQPIRIVRQEYSGLKIPTSSLRVQNGEKGVFALRGTVVIFKKVTILYEHNGYYICKLYDSYNIAATSQTYLSLYDIVVVAGRDLYVGKIVS